MAASDAAQLNGAREDIKELLRTTYCHPILVHNNTASSLLSSLEAISYTILRLPIVPDNHRKSEPVYLDTVSGDVHFCFNPVVLHSCLWCAVWLLHMPFYVAWVLITSEMSISVVDG